MLSATIQVLLYGLLAGLSPLAFAATIAVMQAGRVKALAFGVAFVLAQLATCSVLVLIGVAATGSSSKSHPVLQASLTFALAVALVALALSIRRRPPRAPHGSSERTEALLERLGNLGLPTTLLAGLLLGVGGPKRLLLTVLAATAITTAGLHATGKTLLVILFVVVATALVWAPVVVFVLVGPRVVAMMTTAQQWVADHQPDVIVYALLVLAGLLTLDAIGVLLT